MAESLYIENFLGIKQVYLEINRFNILIGPQASGKSVCAKLLHFFKTFPKDFSDSIARNEPIEEFHNKIERKFLHYFRIRSMKSDNFILKYTINNYVIQISKNSEDNIHEIELTLSDFFHVTYKECLKQFDRTKSLPDQIDASLTSCFKNLDASYFHYQMFIPANRSFCTQFQHEVLYMLSHKYQFTIDNFNFDPFLLEFTSEYNMFKDYLRLTPFQPIREKMDILAQKILNGKFIYDDKEVFIQSEDGRLTNLANASSGQQESLPLITCLLMVLFVDFPADGASIYIEEPEAHLFPTAQKNMVELIATVFNRSEVDLQFIITTHSPYILTSFNNLITAGNLMDKIDKDSPKAKEICEIVPKEQLLKISDFSVYSLQGGTVKSIIDYETRLIDANVIDDVSDDISIQFGQLLEIEHS